MIFPLNKARESLVVDGYRVRGKVIRKYGYAKSRLEQVGSIVNEEASSWKIFSANSDSWEDVDRVELPSDQWNTE